MAYAVPVAVVHTQLQPPPPPRPWDTGLCGCFEDCGSCCMSYWFPCVQFGLNAEKLNPNNSCCCNCCLYWLCAGAGCCCLVHGQKRGELRRKFNLIASCDDCCTTMFCPCCALAQEARQLEIEARKAPAVQTMGVTTISPTQPIMYTAQPTYGQPVYGQPVYNQQPMNPPVYQQPPQQGGYQTDYQQPQPYQNNYQGPPQQYSTQPQTPQTPYATEGEGAAKQL
jgi:Cys-rich protein (TIGR01571 family)